MSDLVTSSRDALAAAIRAEYDKRPPSRYPTERALADALLASGVVREADTLAADERVLDAVEVVADETGHAAHRGVYDGTCRSCVRGRNLARSAVLALAAALDDR